MHINAGKYAWKFIIYILATRKFMVFFKTRCMISFIFH